MEAVYECPRPEQMTHHLCACPEKPAEYLKFRMIEAWVICAKRQERHQIGALVTCLRSFDPSRSCSSGDDPVVLSDLFAGSKTYASSLVPTSSKLRATSKPKARELRTSKECRRRAEERAAVSQGTCILGLPPGGVVTLWLE